MNNKINETLEIRREKFIPATLQELDNFVKMIADAGFTPAGHLDKERKPNLASMKVAIIFGDTLGVGPLASLRNICVINGMPSVWGDLALALCQAHKDFVDVIEEPIENGWRCIAKRRGKKDVVRDFTIQNAEQAGLWVGNKPSEKTKYSPWYKYPQRMLQMRARGFAIRDQFPDALTGIQIAEEYIDMEPEPIDRGESPAEQLRSLKNANESPQEPQETKQEKTESEEKSEETELSKKLAAMVAFLKGTGRTFTDGEKKGLETANTIEDLQKAIVYFGNEIECFEQETGEVFEY